MCTLDATGSTVGGSIPSISGHGKSPRVTARHVSPSANIHVGSCEARAVLRCRSPHSIPPPFTMRGHEKAQGWSTSCKSHDTCWQLGEYPVLRRWSPCRITHVTAVCLSVLDLRRIACAAEAWDCQRFKCSLCCAPRTQSSRHGVANVIAGGAVPCITASYTSDR